MSSVVEIQKAIEQLSSKDKTAISTWLQSQEEPLMTDAEEAAMLTRLDRAAKDLDAGKGVPIDEVRRRVAKWAGR
jgi:hypothetical protein